MTELDVFEKFFDDTFFENLKEETNKYNNHTAAKKDKLGRLEYWKDVSINELKLFFGIILWMGVLVLPTIEHYFTKHPFFRNDFIQNLMSGRRFTNILAMLHLTDNAKNISNQDKIWKIRPIIKHFREKWRSLFQLGENIVIDESIASYKGRLGFKQYAKDKKKKWGVKFWVLADCESGYIYNIKCYTGKNLVNKGKKNLSFDVVTKLLRGLEDRGHHLFIDNYYVSLELIDNLQNNQIGTTGTVNMRRTCFPSFLKDLKVNKSNKFMKLKVI